MTEKRTVLMEEMTWPEYAERVKKEIVFLPVGSTEQHGYHLPLGTDAIQVSRVSELVAAEVGGFVAPCLTYGYRSAPKSGGGEIFPGTTSISGNTLINLTLDILKALIRHGAKRIVVMDGHYENNMFLHEAIHLALEQTGATDVRIIKLLWPEGISPEALDRAFPNGFPGWALEHAAHLETSFIAALRPDLVRYDKIQPDGAENLPLYDIYPQPPDLVPASGVLADPSRATAEIGEMLLQDCIPNLVKMVQEAFAD